MTHRLKAVALSAALAGLAAALPARAAGFLDTTDYTVSAPSPIPGQVTAPLVPLRLDARCMPLTFRVNDTLNPVPNSLGAPFLTLDQATAALRGAADSWNRIPTSWVDLRVDGTVSNPGPRRFDMVNEITFRASPFEFFTLPWGYVFSRDFEPIAIVKPTKLVSDNFLPAGTDLDGDGDSDITAGIATCRDSDGDGDVEFPEGFYKAGTVFDVDIVFNSGATAGQGFFSGLRFTVPPTAPDADPRSVDLVAAATQAFGLAQGIAHTATSQRGAGDGREATMFPQIDTGDPADEAAFRTLDDDAKASSSQLYPEGTAAQGPAALQPGDLPFAAVWATIRGEVRDGARGNVPVAGASVYAVDVLTGRVVSTTVSGHSQYSTSPDGQQVSYLDPAFHNLDGRYELTVPPGLYYVGVEAFDGGPAPTVAINFEAILGGQLGQTTFNEEFYNGPEEGAVEARPAARVPVFAIPGHAAEHVDVVTNRQREIANFGSFNGPRDDAGPGAWYAVRIPGQQFLDADAALGGRALLHGAAFLTIPVDGSTVPVFATAMLTTGRVRSNGTVEIDLDRPLARQSPFVGQDSDYTPLWFENSNGLAERIRQGIAHGQIQDLFLAVRVPDGPFPGVSGAAPRIGKDGFSENGEPPHVFGLSYVSTDGVNFVPETELNYMFKLILSPRPNDH